MIAISCGFKSHLPHYNKVKDTYVSFILIFAEVAELADAQASGACDSNIMRVQVPSSALLIRIGSENVSASRVLFFYLIYKRGF